MDWFVGIKIRDERLKEYIYIAMILDGKIHKYQCQQNIK